MHSLARIMRLMHSENALYLLHIGFHSLSNKLLNQTSGYEILMLDCSELQMFGSTVETK